MSNFREGETLAKQCLVKNGFTVIDRSDQPEYWAKDIDITAEKKGFSAQIEVKWDNWIHKSGAMFLELLTNIQENKQGWANYTEADYIFYGDAKNKIFYVFRADDMRKYLREYKDDYSLKIAKDYNSYDGSIKKESLGAIVPIGLFRQKVRVQEIDIKARLKNDPQKGP